MTADTTRPAADDDAYTLVENLAGMGTLVSAPSTLRYLELTYEAFKLAAEAGRRWRLPAVANVPVEVGFRLWCQTAVSNSQTCRKRDLRAHHEIGERYGIGSPITARRLTGGYANDVFRLDADGPPTILHLKHPPVDADSLNWEHWLLAQLNSHLPEALAPVPALDGSTWFWFTTAPFG